MEILKTSNVIGTESGAIKSFLDQWTNENACLEYSDNKIDVFASKVKFEVSKEGGNFYLKIYHNGMPFTQETLFNYLAYFTYHEEYSDCSVGLRGCGHRWAMYTLTGYRYWNVPTISTVTVESKEGNKIHKGELDIRFPEQENGDVRLFEDEEDSWGDVWYTTVETIKLFNYFSLKTLIDEIRLSYPDSKDVEFEMVDNVKHIHKTIYPIDMTYGIDFIKNHTIWEDVEIGKIKEVVDYEKGTYLLMLIKAPCGKAFKCVCSVLNNKFLIDTKNETMVQGKYAQHKYGGLYGYRGKRFIIHGNSKHLANLLPDRGGCGNCRIIVDLTDNDVANDFGVRANKSNGIDNIVNSPILNPNNTDTDGNNQERRNDRKKSESFVCGVYDYLLELSRTGYHIYGERYSDACDKGGIENTKSKRRLKKNIEKKANDVLKEIGDAEASVKYLSYVIDEKNIIESEAFKSVLTNIVDAMEKNSVLIDNDLFFKVNGETYDLIYNSLKNDLLNETNENKLCLELSTTE